MLWDNKTITWAELTVRKKVLLVSLLSAYFAVTYAVATIVGAAEPLWDSLVSAFFCLFVLEYLFMNAIRMLHYYDGRFGFAMFLLTAAIVLLTWLRILRLI
jgi:hypothetical protein